MSSVEYMHGGNTTFLVFNLKGSGKLLQIDVNEAEIKKNKL
jgi:hypothetical protein